jgi:hypothetical protein
VLHTVTHFSVALILFIWRSALNSTQFVMHISNRKHAAIASRHDTELIPFAVETCGGLGQDAIALLDVISGAASENLSIWSQEDAAKGVLNSVAIAVQKGNAMTVPGAHAAALLRAA